MMITCRLPGFSKRSKRNSRAAPSCSFPIAVFRVGWLKCSPNAPHAYAALSSTHAHNIAWNGWTFLECLIRSLTGDARLDLEQNGRVDWTDLCRFTERHLAFFAEGKPIFATSRGFDPHLQLSAVTKPLSDPQIGQFVQVLAEDEWYGAEIVDLRGAEYKIHYPEYDASNDEWVTAKRMRGFTFERFWVGAPVEIQSPADNEWYPGRVLESWETLHFCHYEEYGPEYDEWFGPSRIRRKTR